jgi:site-specific DNA-cytosine methylase
MTLLKLNSSQDGKVFDENGLSQTLSAGHGNVPKIVAQRERGDNNKQQLEQRNNGITNSLTGVQKDNLLVIGNIYESKGQNGNVYDPDAYLARGEHNRDENGKAVLTSMHDRRIRRLTEIECERLQGFPDVKKSCIFAIWKNNYQEHLKTNAPVVGVQCRKLQRSVGNAEKKDGKETVLSVEQNLNTSYQQTNKPVHVTVLLNCVEQTVEIHSQEKSFLDVSFVELKNLFHQHIKIEDFALLIVHINLILEKIINCGKVVLHQNEPNLIHQKNGEIVLNLFGKGIMQLAKDADIDMTILGKPTKPIISYLLNLPNTEQTLQILSCYALNAIVGYIPKEIQKEDLLIEWTVNSGWTEYGDYDGVVRKMAKTQRYKMLGNAVTVRVVEEIGKRLLK